MISRMNPVLGLTQWASACGIVGVIAWYAFFLYRHVLNVPYQDDIFDVLQILTHLVQSANIQQTFAILFDNYNEHRTLASRLLYYLLYTIEGEINFRTLVFVCNATLVLLLIVLYLAVRHRANSLLLLLAVALILFQPRAYSLYSNAMGACAYMFVYFYGFASLVCLREARVSRFLAAITCATLGTFTLASGQLIWLVGLASLLQQAVILRRCSWAFPVCWALCGALVLAVWRIDYQTVNPMGIVVANVLNSPVHHLAYVFTLMGSALTQTSVLFAFAVGCCLFAALLYWSFRAVSSADSALEFCAWYVVLSMVAITMGRANYTMTSYALESRLSFPSELLLAILTLIGVSRVSNVRRRLQFSAVIVLLASAYWIASFRIYPAYMQKEFEDRVTAYNSGNFWVIYFPLDATNNIVQDAITLGIYHPPARPLPKPDIAPYASAESLETKFRAGTN